MAWYDTPFKLDKHSLMKLIIKFVNALNESLMYSRAVADSGMRFMEVPPLIVPTFTTELSMSGDNFFGAFALL